MPPRLESLATKRLVGAWLIIAAAFFVATMMLVGSGWQRPWQMGVALAVGGIGLLLVRTAATQTRTPRAPVQRPILLLAGIFFTFGMLGPLVMLVSGPQQISPQAGVVGVIIGGTIACGWASAFIFRRLWLIPLVIAFQVFAPPRIFDTLERIGALQNFANLGTQTTRGILAMMILACVVAGYILMTTYVRRVEAAQAHANAELDVARSLHETLVPGFDIRLPAARALGRSAASTEMGGDLIDLIRTDTHADIVIADVAGHGVGAGIVMGMLKSSIRTLLRRDTSLNVLMAELNAVMAELVRDGMFATAAVVRVPTNPAAHPVQYALAGHLPILLRRASGEVVDLPNESLPLAVDSNEQFNVGQVRCAPGDTLLLFTDGLIEVMNPKGRQLGLHAFRNALAAHTASDPAHLAHALLAAAKGHGSQADDQSLVILHFE